MRIHFLFRVFPSSVLELPIAAAWFFPFHLSHCSARLRLYSVPNGSLVSHTVFRIHPKAVLSSRTSVFSDLHLMTQSLASGPRSYRYDPTAGSTAKAPATIGTRDNEKPT